MSSRVLNLRRAAPCSACGTTLPAGTRAHWNAARHVVTCLACHEDPPANGDSQIERGHAGASARREFERRRRNRETRTRQRHPWIGEWLLAVGGSPQHERAFAEGARGERAVGEWLDRRTAKSGSIILHDRRMPGGYGNIDHLAVAPRGVFVIDAKAVNGRVRVSQPLFGASKLLIAGRDRTKFADGLDRQVSAVRDALARTGHSDVDVEGALCFTRADLPLLGSSQIRGHRLHYRRALARRINRGGPLDAEAIARIAHALADAFPAA